MKKVEIWSQATGGEERNILINKEEIVEKGLVDYYGYIIDMTEQQKEELIKYGICSLTEQISDVCDFRYEDTNEILEKVSSLLSKTLKTDSHINIESSENYIELDDSLIFDIDSESFYLANSESMHVVKAYEWYDGSNRIEEINDYAEGIVSETDLVVTEEYVSLDEWDGNNLTTGGIGRHQYIHKVVEKDGEKVDNKFLIVFSSQWQGEHEEGLVVDKEGLIDHLKEIDRDVEEYISRLSDLE